MKQEINRAQLPQHRTKVMSASQLRNKDDASKFAVTIGVPPAEAFAFFRNLGNLPSFMKDLKEVLVLSAQRSHWTVQTSGGHKAEWDAEITAERSGEMIAWKSVEGSQVQTSGAIWFREAPQSMGTVVSLTLDYKIPGGKLAELFTFLTGDHPDELALINLKRLKARLETGEVPTIEGQSSGREEDSTTVVKH